MNTNAKGIPADVLATRATKFGRQFQISDTGSFTVPMNVHVSVGAENAGKVGKPVPLQCTEQQTGILQFLYGNRKWTVHVCTEKRRQLSGKCDKCKTD